MGKKILIAISILAVLVFVAGLSIYIIDYTTTIKNDAEIKLSKEFELKINQTMKLKDEEIYLKLKGFTNESNKETDEVKVRVDYDFTADGLTYSYSSNFNDNEKYIVNIIKTDYKTSATFIITKK